jgi:hypothetical protein
VTEHILIPVSAGELLDKKTILQIKRERIKDPAQLRNVESEFTLLEEAARKQGAALSSPEIQRLEADLLELNAQIWDLENTVRACERSGDHGENFVRTARSIYASNDRRAALKKQINLLLGSTIVEEKSHR